MTILRRAAPVLLLIGTAGLLINEFVFHWGRPATLLFAAISLIGFAIFGMRLLIIKAGQDEENL